MRFVGSEGAGILNNARNMDRALQLLVQHVADYAIYLLDTKGFVTTWNVGGERIKFYSADEIIGTHFSKFFTPEDQAAGLPETAIETARNVGRFESEGWRVRRDGSRFRASAVIDAIHDDDGTLIGFAKITLDITERYRAQQLLQESERRFRTLVEGVTDYALYMLDPNGIVSSWNAGAERIKGYTADEIIGQHFSVFYTEVDRKAGAPANALRTAEREGRFEAEAWRCRKSGEMFWANVIIDPIHDEHGQLSGFAKITRDISERRRKEIELAHAQQQAAQAQKMEALGHLTGGVAHDFNNLLAIMAGQAQLLKRRNSDNPKVVTAAEHIITATQRGSALTRQLLTFARRQPANPEHVQFAQMVEDFRAMLTSALTQGYDLSVSVAPDLWPVHVDANEFELALLNLVVNARDAMPSGGRVSIIAENAVVREGQLRDNLSGQFLAVTVADVGFGIPPDVLPKIFDPFFTTKANLGSGLGLAQVFGFVRGSGGDIAISTEVGKGTRATLYLPRAQQQAESRRAAHEPAQGGARGVILVVEDNPQVAEVTREMLGDLGYTTHGANSADAALQALAGGLQADAVLSDVVMPGTLDGLGLVEKLRETRPDLPVLLMSGYTASAKVALSDFPVLRKPFDISELAREIGRLFGGTTASNVVPIKSRTS